MPLMIVESTRNGVSFKIKYEIEICENDQKYEFIAQSVEEKKKWVDCLLEAKRSF